MCPTPVSRLCFSFLLSNDLDSLSLSLSRVRVIQSICRHRHSAGHTIRISIRTWAENSSTDHYQDAIHPDTDILVETGSFERNFTRDADSDK